MKRSSVRGDYRDQNSASAKKIAPARNEVNSKADITDILDNCLNLERQGNYGAAAKLLSPFWDGVGFSVNTDGLTTAESAELLLRVGSVAAFLSSSEQIVNGQNAARNYLKAAEALYEELGDEDGIAKVFVKLGFSAWCSGDMEAAKPYFKDALERASVADTKASAYLNLANAELFCDEFVGALALYEKAQEYFGKISLVTEGNIQTGIGLASKNLGKRGDGAIRAFYFNKAVEHFELALRCYDRIGHHRFSISTKNNLAQLYLASNRLPEARPLLEIAKAQAMALNDRNMFGTICDTLTIFYLKTGDNFAAEAESEQAIKSLLTNESSTKFSEALRNHAIALARRGARLKAKHAFLEAEVIARNVGDEQLAWCARLFSLVELFGEFSEYERIKILLGAVNLFAGSQDQEIIDALKLAAEKADSLTREMTPVLEFKSGAEELTIDQRLESIERSWIEKALDDAKGNQTHAANMLGLKRQTLIARVQNKYPDLLPHFNQIKKQKSA